jgi:predicted transcriptional regulator
MVVNTDKILKKLMGRAAAEVAKRAGVSPSTVYAVKKGCFVNLDVLKHWNEYEQEATVKALELSGEGRVSA